MHAVADQSIDNLQIVCVYGHIQLQTIVTKVEDGYKLKYDVHQVPNIVVISFWNMFLFRSNVEMSQWGNFFKGTRSQIEKKKFDTFP